MRNQTKLNKDEKIKPEDQTNKIKDQEINYYTVVKTTGNEAEEIKKTLGFLLHFTV